MIAACLLMADILKLNTPTDRDVRFTPKSGHRLFIISSAICWRHSGDYPSEQARDTYWSSRIGLLWRTPMLAFSKSPYTRPALRKAFAAFPADTKVV
jgi:hypothetical protein